MADFGLFLKAVFAHWITWVGIALTIVPFFPKSISQLIEKKILRSKFNPKHLWMVASLFLFISFYQAWHDEHQNTQNVIVERAIATAANNSCQVDRRIEQVDSRGLENLNRTLQQTIDHMQLLGAQQQGTVNSCVVSLGKMNPKIRESINVVHIPLFTMDPRTQRLVSFYMAKKVYVSELIITTNEVEPRFHGILRCANPFSPIGSPQLPPSSQTAMVITVPPSRISDKEYEISITNSGTEWGPVYPAYMRIFSDLENPGKCTFLPQ